MKVSAFEWASCGGLWVDPQDPEDCTFLQEGQQILSVVLAASSASAYQVATCIDTRFEFSAPSGSYSNPLIQSAECALSTLLDQWCQAAVASDAALLVLPECEGLLEQATEFFREQQLPLLNCGRELIRMASDKWLTAEFCRVHDLPHPPTVRFDPESQSTLRRAEDQALRSVAIKPRDGAGCEGILVTDREGLARFHDGSTAYIVQPWIQGDAYSCSAVVDIAGQWHWLPPVSQVLRTRPWEGREFRGQTLKYEGGALMLDLNKDEGLLALLHDFQNAVHAEFPRQALGWVGVDLIRDKDGWWLIEVNPRCTTSIVGLHQSCSANLAEVLVRSAFEPLEPGWLEQTLWRPLSFRA